MVTRCMVIYYLYLRLVALVTNLLGLLQHLSGGLVDSNEHHFVFFPHSEVLPNVSSCCVCRFPLPSLSLSLSLSLFFFSLCVHVSLKRSQNAAVDGHTVDWSISDKALRKTLLAGSAGLQHVK